MILEVVASAIAIWLAVLKTREHFIKYPLRKRKGQKELEQ